MLKIAFHYLSVNYIEQFVFALRLHVHRTVCFLHLHSVHTSSKSTHVFIAVFRSFPQKPLVLHPTWRLLSVFSRTFSRVSFCFSSCIIRQACRGITKITVHKMLHSTVLVQIPIYGDGRVYLEVSFPCCPPTWIIMADFCHHAYTTGLQRDPFHQL